MGWGSMTNKWMTQSVSESEYVALACAAKEALFIRGILPFVQPRFRYVSTRLYNEGAESLAEDPHTQFFKE